MILMNGMLQHKKLFSGESAFTLIELLGVIGIVAILLGIILGAVSSVQRYSRKAVAQTEVRTIESAWRRYFDHYGFWPTNTTGQAGYVEELSGEGIYHTYKIGADMGIALDGRCTNDVSRSINPDGIHFMEFSRYGDSDGESVPANPYINSYGAGRGTSSDPGCHYFVCFDINGNDDISTDKLRSVMRSGKFGFAFDQPSVARPVIVWTVNRDDNDVIGSWFK